MSVTLRSNAQQVKANLNAACNRALERIGLQAEGYAIDLAPVDTERLRNSITHAIAENEVYIGTNVEYAPYVELGTGKYYPGGRPTPWAYQDAKGNWHWTAGNPAQPFLYPAVANHTATYKNIVEGDFRTDNLTKIGATTRISAWLYLIPPVQPSGRKRMTIQKYPQLWGHEALAVEVGNQSSFSASLVTKSWTLATIPLARRLPLSASLLTANSLTSTL